MKPIDIISDILETKANMSGLGNKRDALSAKINEANGDSASLVKDKEGILEVIAEADNNVDIFKDALEAAKLGLKRAQSEVKNAAKRVEDAVGERASISEESINEIDSKLLSLDEYIKSIEMERDKISDEIESLNTKLNTQTELLREQDMDLSFLDVQVKSKNTRI